MSLINQMLKDLESRRAAGDLSQRAVDGMGNAARRKQRKQNLLLLGLVGVVAVLAAISGYLLWQERQSVPVAQTTDELQPVKTPVVAAVKTPAASQKKIVSDTPAESASTSMPLVKKSTATQSAIVETPAGVTRPDEDEEEVVTESVEPAVSTAPAEKFKKRLRPQSNEQLAELEYQRGYSLLQRGDRKGAEDAWREALRIDATHAASRESLAILYLSQSRRIEAAEQLQLGVANNPGNSKLALLYARMQLDAKDVNGAIKTLEAAMRAAPQGADFYAFTAAAYQRQGDYEKSIATYQAALKQQPGQSVWWMGLGISLESAGKAEEALAAYNEAKKSNRLAPKLRQYVEGRIQALE